MIFPVLSPNCLSNSFIAVLDFLAFLLRPSKSAMVVQAGRITRTSVPRLTELLTVQDSVFICTETDTVVLLDSILVAWIAIIGGLSLS